MIVSNGTYHCSENESRRQRPTQARIIVEYVTAHLSEPSCLRHHASTIVPVPSVKANIAQNRERYNLGCSRAIVPAKP